jgi:MoxR-like ATPase
MQLSDLRDLNTRLRAEIGRVIIGQEEVVDRLFVALLAQGHVLLEGVPGTAKTLLARAFAACLDLHFNRIQFTPDLMPGDVIGTNLFNFQSSSFVLTRGPIFTQVLLADEINRTPPKTQAALLQAMQERLVTIDGTTYPLGAGFMVVATQNPIEQEGTYPLPEAQLDRFLFKLRVDYPSREEELEMVRRHGHRTAMPRLEDFQLQHIGNLETLEAVRAMVAEIHLGEELVAYVVDLVRATRTHEALWCGTSPRSANMLAAAARAQAALQGRAYVIPDDVKGLAVPTLGHRVVLAPAAEIEGMTTGRVLEQIVERTPAPK